MTVTVVRTACQSFECPGCGARLDVEPCICRLGEDWANLPEVAEFMAEGRVWR